MAAKKKYLVDKVEAILEEEAPVVTKKAAKKVEEPVVEESEIAKELHTWNLPKTIFEQLRKWLEGKNEEEMEEINLTSLKDRVVRLVEEKLPVSTTTELIKILLSKHDAGKPVTDDQFEEIVSRINKEYEMTRVQPCEAVGICAAHSIGEPGTQMTM
ncbi:MAG TPA: DNA-directed RNA polymerase subunit A'', partial [Methanocorpusculum sp.]|nr:DNA-directed RNA polymerase subunit A'' [Methanocorpusculum sp.]